MKDYDFMNSVSYFSPSFLGLVSTKLHIQISNRNIMMSGECTQSVSSDHRKGNFEGVTTSFIVVKNQNCQAYFCVFF